MCILFIIISRILRYDSLSVISIEINTLPELFKFYIKMFYTILCRGLEKIITNEIVYLFFQRFMRFQCRIK